MNPVISISVYMITQLLVMEAVGRGIYSFMEAGWIRRTACLIVFLVYLSLALLPVAGALLPDSSLKFRLQAAGNIWLGFAVYLLLGLLVFLPGIRLFHLIRRHPKEPVIGFAVAAAAVFSLVILFYGMAHAQKTKVTRLSLSTEKPLGETHHLKLVLIGDLHMSVNSKPEMIRRIVEMINEEDADAVLIAGDFLTSSYEALASPEEYEEALRGIRSRDGVFAVYGNHDVEETLFGGFPISPVEQAFRSEEIEQFIRDCGVTALCDEQTEIAGGAVQIVGRLDGEKAGDGTSDRKTAAEVLADTDPEKEIIVLQHEPVGFEALRESGADLVLCGHTHNGQIFPGNLIVPFFNENAYGLKTIGGMDTVVTSGTGYYGPPMRVGTDSEIMVLEISEK